MVVDDDDRYVAGKCAAFVSAALERTPLPFRDGPKDQTSDVQLRT
jgi:hypothetical protein